LINHHFLLLDGLGAKVHMANPISPTGPNKSQMPMPSWKLAGNFVPELEAADGGGLVGNVAEDRGLEIGGELLAATGNEFVLVFQG
jgi:hypothetical protein